jgi:hypothetical protein
MTNPDFGGPPGTNPPRYPRDDGRTKVWAWIISIAGVVAVLLVVFTLSSGNHNATVSNPATVTTGQGGTNPDPTQNAPNQTPPARQ